MLAPSDPIIGYCEFVDGIRWPIYADGERQFTYDDEGERVYGHFLIPDEERAALPFIVGSNTEWKAGFNCISPLCSKKCRVIARELRRRKTAKTAFPVSKILAWADAFHDRTGEWPRYASGSIPELLGTNWRMVDNALRYGLPGLPGGSSLAKLLAKRRDVRNTGDLPPLTEEQIIAWANAHRRTGKWPDKNSGPIIGVPGEDRRNLEGCRDGLDRRAP